jgi:hypothetical protein
MMINELESDRVIVSEENVASSIRYRVLPLAFELHEITLRKEYRIL